jgi:hypothetical protein
VPDDLARDVRMYAAMVDDLPRYDEWMEVTNLLVWRDAIHDALRAGARLSSPEVARLETADARLAEHRSFIAERSPEVAERTATIPKEYWWWHLDERPSERSTTDGERGVRTA